jgi:uncharacterized 2Fe-2S/4Fe-4S cluster protein (DUF4445 family)
MRVRFEPFGTEVDVAQGATLLEAANAAGVEIERVCGGRGTCAKCKVIVTEGVSPPTASELKGLTEAELSAGYRLACQTHVEGPVDVVVPEESQVSRVSILSHGVSAAIELEPWVRWYTLEVPAATLEDQTADAENVARILQREYDRPFEPTLAALRQLPGALRAQEGHLSLLEVDDRIVRVMAGAGPPRPLGVAFDIGTTTIVGYLLDLETGQELGVSSLLNPQTRHGDDVVSRIDYGTQNADGLQSLQALVVGAMNQIIADVLREAGRAAEAIVAITVVGNTTMQHLLLGIDPAALALAPYVPVVVQPTSLQAAELDLEIEPEAQVWVAPNIAGWVGGDTVGVILSTGMFQQDELALAIDIGTNGEMALGSRERLVTCSTAAGPAFEGAHLSCGMRAASGAIDVVTMNDAVEWHAIEDRPPRGICGSGLVDVIAGLLQTGVLDVTGMMQEAETLRTNGHRELAGRIVEEGRWRAFELVEAAHAAGGRPVRVTQRDVRELQLAKGAIRAGIEILLKELGVGPEAVEKVYLAGAFGNYIRPESALAIGLLPHFPNAEIVPVGNAAGSGARMALLSRRARADAATFPTRVEYLELSGRADFQEHFAEAMLFG